MVVGWQSPTLGELRNPLALEKGGSQTGTRAETPKKTLQVLRKFTPFVAILKSFVREGSRKRGVTKKDRRMCEGAAQRGPRPIAAHPHLPARPHHWPGAWERLMSQKGSVLYFCFYCGVWM